MHGDVDSLAGWALGVELLEPLDLKLRAQLGCGPQHVTPRAQLLDWFREAGVDAILSTHTCLPFGQGLEGLARREGQEGQEGREAGAGADGGGRQGGGVEGGTAAGPERLVLFNNGAAGMPNFRGVRAGLVTRVPPSLPLPSLPLPSLCPTPSTPTIPLPPPAAHRPVAPLPGEFRPRAAARCSLRHRDRRAALRREQQVVSSK